MASTTISKVICDCGEEVGKYYLSKHKLTQKHLNKMKEMEKLINTSQREREEKSKSIISEAIKNKKARQELKLRLKSKINYNIKSLENINLNLNPNILNKLFQFYKIITEEQKYFFTNYVINTLTNSFGYKINEDIILNILNLKKEDENIKWDNDFLNIILIFITKIEKELHDIPYNQSFEKNINKKWSGDYITFKYLTDYFNIKKSKIDIIKESYDIFKKRYIGTSMRNKLISYIIEEGFMNL